MLCDYVVMQRDLPFPKYKKRYNQYGEEDIYGEYDINRMYRAFEFDASSSSSSSSSSSRNNVKFIEEDKVAIQLLPTSSSIVEGDGQVIHTTSEIGETVTTNNKDDDDEDDESSGEYPPGYFEMHTSDTELGGDDNEDEQQQQQQQGQTFRCYECIRRQQRSEYHIEDSRRMTEALRDIKNVLLRRMNSHEDSVYYLELVKQILHTYESTTCIVPNPLTAYEESMLSQEQQPTKKRKTRDDTLDIEYKYRIGDTDCFHCTLCDPDKVNTIRINSWADHCNMSGHRSMKANDVAEKRSLGLI